MINVKLPVVYPPITSYPEIAHIFSILFSNEQKIIPWISDRFVQVIVRENKESAVVDFYDHADIDNYFSLIYGCPFISWMRVSSSIIRGNSLVEYLDFCLKQGYYVEPCLDQYYFSFTYRFSKEHFIHTALLSEIDYENNRVRIHDFFNEKRYDDHWVDIESLEKSMNNDYLINLYKYQEADYEWNVDLLRTQLSDFLNADDSLRYFEHSYQSYNKSGIWYGISVYDYLLGKFMEGDKAFDSKPIHILYDRQELMLRRLKYMATLRMFDDCTIETIKKECVEIKELLLVVRNMVLKYNLLQDKSIVNKICGKLQTIKQKELSMSEKILYMIK